MSYNRYMANADIEDSALHKVKATYWETKQKILSKINKNQDEHVQASDAELDAKIEVLKSVQRTTDQLMRLVNEYEYCMFALAKNEYAFSRFLKTQSEVDKTRAGKIMAAVGRVENFSSQQRLGFRQPLERLYQECETFRLRAVADTASNLENAETARNDYRAALLWMKDVSEELDPDTTKQLEKFRKVQAQVRKKKDRFDRLKLDVMQKVDMLAASRANMFSRALEFYQKWMMEYYAKNARTLEIVAKGFSGMYHFYEFNVIKDLAEPNKLMAEKTGSAVDDEQMQAIIQELETAISELANCRDAPPPTVPTVAESDENFERDYRYYKEAITSPQKNDSGQGDLDLLADLADNDERNPFSSNNGDDSLILAEDPEKGKDQSKKSKEASNLDAQQDLMSTDFFDIEKADGAMAELHKRQRERTMGNSADEQLLMSLAGPASTCADDASNQGGLAAHEELKLLDDLLSVMNQGSDNKQDDDAGMTDAIGDLRLDNNWHNESLGGSRGGAPDLDFLRPAEAQALLPSQLLELQTGHSSSLFSMPFGPFGTNDNKTGGTASLFGKQNASSPFVLQEQQRSGLLLGPTSVGKVVQQEKPSLGELAGLSGSKSSAKGSAASHKDSSSKFDLFADLDPFANPDAIGKQIQTSDADQI